MDLNRVAFVGHSFGGGAIPDMAYKGLVENGWGKSGAFMMELAPWYLYGITNAQMAKLPADAIQFVEVYDRDTVNDHRIAIHLYDASRASQRYYVLVQSNSACGFTADHSTPGSNASLVQKEYAVFRPFDMLADLAFNGTSAARQALGDLGEPGSGYRPLRRLTAPTPDRPESNYRWPWSSPHNPQR